MKNEYEYKFLNSIKNAHTDEQIIILINRIYQDGYEDGTNNQDADAPSTNQIYKIQKLIKEIREKTPIDTDKRKMLNTQKTLLETIINDPIKLINRLEKQKAKLYK